MPFNSNCCRRAKLLYPEGVTYHSPGLNAKRSTLGNDTQYAFAPHPEGVRSGETTQVIRPFQGRIGICRAAITQGRTLRVQPWAMICNPFGVKTIGMVISSLN